MPRGDFVTRNSFYEALCAGSIPVVMERNYFRHCAFYDIIDYSRFVQILPEEAFMGNISQNAVELVVVQHDDGEAAHMLSGLWQVKDTLLRPPPCCAPIFDSGFVCVYDGIHILAICAICNHPIKVAILHSCVTKVHQTINEVETIEKDSHQNGFHGRR